VAAEFIDNAKPYNEDLKPIKISSFKASSSKLGIHDLCFLVWEKRVVMKSLNSNTRTTVNVEPGDVNKNRWLTRDSEAFYGDSTMMTTIEDIPEEGR